jgi:hypothetical protein
MPSATLTRREINRATLARQMLLAREKTTALDAIERLLAMQAQWPRPPFIGLWTRVDGFRREDLVRLLIKRQVVRATFFRATIHLMTARTYLALRPTIQPMLAGAMQTILKERLDGVDLDALVARARKHFAKTPCTFEDFRDHLLAADPKSDERALGYAVRMRLPLVQVPAADGEAWAFPSQACFTPAEDWLGKSIKLAGPPKIDDLVRRYLAAYGPASVADIQAWTGLKIDRAVLDGLRNDLVTFKDESKRELFDLPDAPRPDADTPAPIRFVPDYDSMIVARTDERFVAKPHRPHVFLSALRIAATLLVDGFVAGTWTLETKKKASAVIVKLFATVPERTRKAVAAEGEQLARFVDPDAKSFECRVS